MKNIKVGIIGLGYVGLQMLVTMSKEKKLNVFGFDIDKKKISNLKSNKSYIGDIKDTELKKINKKNLILGTNNKLISKLNYIIICLPTPLTTSNKPDNSFIINSFKSFFKFLKKNQTIVLESTVYPGGTKEIFYKKLNKKFNVGKNFFLGFSSERINPGDQGLYAPKEHKIKYTNVPKLISGFSSNCLKKIFSLYKIFFSKCYKCENIEIAEFSKLYENTFRYVNICLVNELKIIASRMQINFSRVLNAAKTKPFGFKPFFTSPGIGGHCIPVDPNFINWKAKKYNTSSKFIKTSNLINRKIIDWTTIKILEEYKKIKKKNKKILIIGITYKKNVEDLRESAPLKIFKKLRNKKIDVSYHDNFANQINFNGSNYNSIPLNESVLKKRDLVVICTNHSGINYKKILKHSKLIIDTIGAYQNINNKKIVHA